MSTNKLCRGSDVDQVVVSSEQVRDQEESAVGDFQALAGERTSRPLVFDPAEELDQRGR
jgi:hypothetical protein